MRYGRFKDICKGSQSKISSINIDSPVRWSSTYCMINKAIKLKYQLVTWESEEGISNEQRLIERDWEELIIFKKALKVFSDVSTFHQGQNYPTMHSVIATYNMLFDAIDDLHETYPENKGISDAFQKLKKYYKLSDDCQANYISSVLNPNEKMNYYSDMEFPLEAQMEIKKL